MPRLLFPGRSRDSVVGNYKLWIPSVAMPYPSVTMVLLFIVLPVIVTPVASVMVIAEQGASYSSLLVIDNGPETRPNDNIGPLPLEIPPSDP